MRGYLKGCLVNQAFLTIHLLLSILNFSSFFNGKLGCKNQEQEQTSRVRRNKLGLLAKGKLLECSVNPF